MPRGTYAELSAEQIPVPVRLKFANAVRECDTVDGCRICRSCARERRRVNA